MISLEDIDKTILDLEQHDTTYATCEKLAWLYVCRDHLKKTQEPAQRKADTSGSEFLDAVSAAPLDQALQIIDEHMDCIKSLYPREYNAIIKKIKEL